MKKGVFITIRSDSSRLPGKAFKLILGTPVLEMVIKRAKRVKDARVVVCTTTRAIDDCVLACAQKMRVACFRGSLEDKLARWQGALHEFGLDCFATFDADDLLCSPELIDESFQQLEKEKLDFLRAPANLGIGAFTYCIAGPALDKVCAIKDSEDTEMMWTYFEDTGLFKVGDLQVRNPVLMHPFRLTLDYPEDFAFFQHLFEHFNNVDNDVPLEDVMDYLIQHPEIVEINAFRSQEWRQNQIAKTKLQLKK